MWSGFCEQIPTKGYIYHTINVNFKLILHSVVIWFPLEISEITLYSMSTSFIQRVAFLATLRVYPPFCYESEPTKWCSRCDSKFLRMEAWGQTWQVRVQIIQHYLGNWAGKDLEPRSWHFGPATWFIQTTEVFSVEDLRSQNSTFACQW